jgi:2,3-bisphosphoglycerate-dependent phosphoglycerate mutase
MVTIIFEAHSTSFDNENNLASGWNDVRLSPKGIDQAKELGKRYEGQTFHAIFCSDLKRSYQTATLAFDFDPRLIRTDWRLRECDYGQYTQVGKLEVDAEKLKHIEIPFVDGESYAQCMERMGSFLADLRVMFEGKKVMVIGHRATQYGLEHFINNKTLEACISDPWQWQPGWTYELQ